MSKIAYFAANSTSDGWDSPDFASMPVTDEFIARLTQMQSICVANGLSEVREYRGPKWGVDGYEQEQRLECEEMVVSPDAFWFEASPKHSDATIDTSYQPIAQFLAEVAKDGDEPLCFGDAEWDDILSAQAEAVDNAGPGGMAA